MRCGQLRSMMPRSSASTSWMLSKFSSWTRSASIWSGSSTWPRYISMGIDRLLRPVVPESWPGWGAPHGRKLILGRHIDPATASRALDEMFGLMCRETADTLAYKLASGYLHCVRQDRAQETAPAWGAGVLWAGAAPPARTSQRETKPGNRGTVPNGATTYPARAPAAGRRSRSRAARSNPFRQRT